MHTRGSSVCWVFVRGAWSQDPVGQRLIHAADFGDGYKVELGHMVGFQVGGPEAPDTVTSRLELQSLGLGEGLVTLGAGIAIQAGLYLGRSL